MADIRVALAPDPKNLGVDGVGQARDLYLLNGSPVLVTSLADVVSQDLLIALALFQGEWFLDPSQGMPYFQRILGKVSDAIVRRIFQSAILSRPGVASIQSFSMKRGSNRSLSLSFAVRLTNGAILDSSAYGTFIVGV